MYTAAQGECNYVNSLRGTCYYYYIIIILISIIPNILISVGMQCLRAEEKGAWAEKDSSGLMEEWMNYRAETKKCQRRGEVL